MDQINECDGADQEQNFLATKNQKIVNGNRSRFQYRRFFWIMGVLLLVIGSGLAIARLPRHGSEYERANRFPPPDAIGRVDIYISNPANGRSRRIFERVRFPVARYHRRVFPLKGPFMNFKPWTSIVVDQRTEQTIVYSDPWVYILPSMVNKKNRLYSIAELISAGYASFYRGGDSPMTRNFDMTRFFQFSRLDGPDVPRFSSSKGRFDGGMKTNYGSYRTDDDDDDDNDDESYSRDEKYYAKTKRPDPETSTKIKPTRAGTTPTRKPGEVHYTLIIDTVFPYAKSDKPVIAANYTSPGPLLEAYDDETFVIRVINRLDVPSTMHWHGMRQFGTQDMDGAVGVTQCAIPPNGEMIYRFKADPAGTAWYHGHLLEQYSDGLYGPLVVHRRQNEPNKNLYSSEKILLVSDWYNNRSHDELIPWYINANNPDGVEPSPDAIMVNDKFTHSMFVSLNNVQRVRFRIINAAAFSMYTVSIDGLPLHIIEVDSMPTIPYVVSSFAINVGQRVSFYIDWSELDSVYTQSGSSATDAVYIRFEAMLSMYPVDIVNYIPPYASQQYPYPTFFKPLYLAFLSLNSINSTPSYSASDATPALSNVNTVVDTNLLDARPFDPANNVVPSATHRLDLLVVFQPDMDGINRPSINNVTYTSDANYMHMRPDPPTGITSDLYAPLLHQMATKPNDLGISPPIQGNGDPLPVIQSDNNGHYLIPYNAVVDILINNTDGGEHPFHLHGYTFWIIATSDYPLAETLYAGQYIQRDTVSVPASGWTKIRLFANNPGAWFFHCHIEWHMSAGLAMALVVSPKQTLDNGYTITSTQKQLCKALKKFNAKVGTTN